MNPPCLIKHLLGSDLGDSSINSRRVGTTDGLDQFAVLEEEEGRHSGDAVLSGDVGEVIDVDLVELDVAVGLAELLNGGGNSLARTAPVGEEVNNNGLLGLGDLGLVLLSAANRKC
jgi:hypothetical protein